MTRPARCTSPRSGAVPKGSRSSSTSSQTPRSATSTQRRGRGPYARACWRRSPTGRAREADYPNGLDAYFGNQCADTEYPGTFSQFRAIDRYARAGSRFGPNWWWFNNGCTHWPVADDRYTGPWTARTNAPVLVVGNFFDGVTDHAGAVATSRLLKNSRLLSYAGWGHTAYGRSACTQEFVNAYLLEQRLPPAGTVCPANPNPFLAATTTSDAGDAHGVGSPPDWMLMPEP